MPSRSNRISRNVIPEQQVTSKCRPEQQGIGRNATPEHQDRSKCRPGGSRIRAEVPKAPKPRSTNYSYIYIFIFIFILLYNIHYYVHNNTGHGVHLIDPRLQVAIFLQEAVAVASGTVSIHTRGCSPLCHGTHPTT